MAPSSRNELAGTAAVGAVAVRAAVAIAGASHSVLISLAGKRTRRSVGNRWRGNFAARYQTGAYRTFSPGAPSDGFLGHRHHLICANQRLRSWRYGPGTDRQVAVGGALLQDAQRSVQGRPPRAGTRQRRAREAVEGRPRWGHGRGDWRLRGSRTRRDSPSSELRGRLGAEASVLEDPARPCISSVRSEGFWG